MKLSKSRSLAKVAVNKSLLKEYVVNSERKVYLNDDTEFQIYLYNPYDYTIGVDISINGKGLTNTLILRPGENIWLERYLPSNNKFRFSTYTVDNSAEARNAIANNGQIEIKFYKERELVYYGPTYTYCMPGIRWDDDFIYNTPLKKNYIDYNVSSIDNLAAAPNLSSISTTTAATTANFCSTSTHASVAASEYTASATAASTIDTQIKTGRIEKGSYSGQSFDKIDIDLEYYPFLTERIQILPISTKPIYKDDLAKKYCPTCGHKVKQKFAYCPFCGARLN